MTTELETQYQAALALAQKQQYQQARALWDDLALQYAVSQQPQQQANCLLESGECYYYLGQYEQAITQFELLLTLLTKLPAEFALRADTYENLGICYGELGKYECEISYKQDALSLRLQHLSPKDLSIGQSLNNLGYTFEKMGDSQQALQYFKQALAIFEQYPEAQNHLATCYNNIGNCYSEMGDYENALNYHTEALNYRRQLSNTTLTQLWTSLNNMGYDHLHCYQYAEAQRYFAEALLFAQAQGQAKIPYRQIAIAHNNLGVCYREQAQYEQAIAQHQASIEVLAQLGEAQQMPNYCNIGEIYIELQQYDKAQQHYEIALDIAQQLPAPKYHNAIAHRGLAHCLLQNQQAEQALQRYNKALECLLPTTPTSHSQAIPDQYADPKTLIQVWRGKISALVQLYDQAQQQPDLQAQYVAQATHTCQTALHFLQRLRHYYRAENAKIQLTEKAFGIAEQTIALLFRQAEQNNPSQYYALAFDIAEQSKALALLANLRHAEAKQQGNIDPQLLAEEQRLSSDLNVLTHHLQTEQIKGDAALIAQWQTRHLHCQTQYEQLMAEIETNYPDYYRLKYQTHTASVAEVQARIATNEQASALLSYCSGEHDLYIFHITEKNVYACRQSKTDEYKQQIARFLRALKTLDKPAYCQTAHWLYQYLLPPTLRQANSAPPLLTILPDRELLYLPFDALLTQAVEQWATPYANMPYFLYRYSCSYHYSATLWLQKRPTFAPLSPTNLLAFAPVEFASKGNMPAFRALSSSADTLAAIQQLYEQSHSKTHTVIGKSATWRNFKQQSAQYRHLLLYTHADFNEAQPNLSRILWATDPDDETDSCYLADTYNLALQADLLVLGACETGMGEIRKGEGMVGMTRGFLYAGARHILFSLLKIPEQSAAQLLVAFFAQLTAQPKQYAQALHQAKLQIVQQSSAAPPLAWAGWVLLGE